MFDFCFFYNWWNFGFGYWRLCLNSSFELGVKHQYRRNGRPLAFMLFALLCCDLFMLQMK